MMVSLRICVAWWLGWYLAGLVFVCRVTGREPDWGKVGRIAQRAIRLRSGLVIPWDMRLALWWSNTKYRARRYVGRLMGFLRPWVHTPDDGRGMRRVYVDGVEVRPVVYADTRAGFVRCYHDPIRLDRKREVARTYKVRGEVVVEAM